MTRRGRDEGSIYQRGSDGRWVGAVTISQPGRPRRRRSVVRATRAEVRDALRDMMKDMASGIVPAGRDVTVRSFLEGWLAGVPKLRARTVLRYGELLRQHVMPEISAIQLAKLQPGDVRTLLATLSKKPGRTGRPLSAQTVCHARAVLRRALSDAVGDGLIVRNVAAGKTVNAPTPKRHLIEAMTPAQANAIVEAVRDDAFGPLYRLLLWTGLRLGEATGLRWSDVDLDRGWIRVRQTYALIGGVGRFDEPKTSQSKRDVPIIDQGHAALRDQKRRQAEDRLLVGQAWEDTGLVFTNPLGQPIDPRQPAKRLHVLLAPIGLGTLRVHDLRHAFVTAPHPPGCLDPRHRQARGPRLAGHDPERLWARGRGLARRGCGPAQQPRDGLMTRRLTRAERDTIDTAWHEAGHVAIALALGGGRQPNPVADMLADMDAREASR